MLKINKTKSREIDFNGEISNLSDEDLSTLTGATLVTAILVYIISITILQSKLYLVESLAILFVSAGLIFINYLFADITKSLSWSLAIIFGLISIAIVFDNFLYISLLSCLAIGGAYSFFAKFSWDGKDLQILSACGFFGAVLIFFQPLSGETIPFDILKRLQLGNVSIDALFHASIASMIKNYLTVSSGMNGLVETPYHVFSHIVMAGLSSISRISVVEVYNYSRWIFFEPLLMLAVTASSVQLNGHPRNILFTWIVVSIVLIAYPAIASIWGGWDQYFTSESYLVAIILLMTILPTLCKNHLAWNEYLLIILYAGLISLSKISVGIVFSIFLLARLVLVFNNTKDLLLLLGVLTSIYIQLGYSEAVTSGASFEALSFLREYTKYGIEVDKFLDLYRRCQDGVCNIYSMFYLLLKCLGIFLCFIFIHFIAVWSGIIVNFSGAINKLKSSYLLQIYLAISFVVGLFATLVLKVPGGSVYYISNICLFISMPFLIVIGVIIYKNYKKLTLSFLVYFLMQVTVLEVINYHERSHNFRSLRLDHQTIITSLSEIRGRLPKNSIIKYDEVKDLKIQLEKWKCLPFIFPALTEYAWVDVIQLWGDCRYENYSFAHYGIDSNNQIPKNPPRIRNNMRMYRWKNSSVVEEIEYN